MIRLALLHLTLAQLPAVAGVDIQALFSPDGGCTAAIVSTFAGGQWRVF